MISASEIRQKACDKKSYWEVCVRNRIFLPSVRDAFVSTEFMELVRKKEAWLPKTDECK